MFYERNLQISSKSVLLWKQTGILSILTEKVRKYKNILGVHKMTDTNVIDIIALLKCALLQVASANPQSVIDLL